MFLEKIKKMKDQEILKNLNVYNFTKAADKANKYPIILAMVFKGELHLSGVNIIGPHLTLANHVDLLKQCRHLSKRQIQEIAVQLMPKPDVKDAIRKLPETSREITKVKDSNINLESNTPQIIPKVMALTSSSGANEKIRASKIVLIILIPVLILIPTKITWKSYLPQNIKSSLPSVTSLKKNFKKYRTSCASNVRMEI